MAHGFPALWKRSRISLLHLCLALLVLFLLLDPRPVHGQRTPAHRGWAGPLMWFLLLA